MQKRKAATSKPKRDKPSRSLLNLLRVAPLNNRTVSLPLGLPERLRIPLKYSTTFVVDADVDTDNVFALNGLYDPDVTQTGHQPYLFDQFMAMYERYRVLRTAVKLSYAPVSSTNSGAVFLSIWRSLSGSNIEGTGINAMSDRTGVVSRITNGIGSEVAPSVTSEDDIHMITDTDKYAPGLYGSSGANPSTVAYAHCFLATLDGSTSLAGRAFVEMVFDVEFSRRAVPSSSVDTPLAPVGEATQSCSSPATSAQTPVGPETTAVVTSPVRRATRR
jgi:hypothetical protein